MDEFWVFGYGSLMWNPGFLFQERQLAHIGGYRRALCIHSYVHRGTQEKPGLVLGLDRGGSCRGVAFRVADADWPATLDYLRERELVTSVYLEKMVRTRLADGRIVQALTYVTDRRHPQYAGMMDAQEAAKIVYGASGKSGPNPVYVANTLEHLRELGIRDMWLEQVQAKIADLSPV